MKLFLPDMASSNAKFGFTFKEIIPCQKAHLYWEISLIIVISITITIIMKNTSPVIFYVRVAMPFYMFFIKLKIEYRGNFLFISNKVTYNFLACVPTS